MKNQKVGDMNRRHFVQGLVAAPLTYGVLASTAPLGAAFARGGEQSVALVTGASSGFGYATAKTLARNGFHVIASMRNVQGANAEPATTLADLADKEDLKLDIVEIDIDSDDSVESGMANAMSRTDRIDVLFNNAGINVPGPIELSMDAARQNFETNVSVSCGCSGLLHQACVAGGAA